MDLLNTLLFVFLHVHLYGNVKMEYFDYSCVSKSGIPGRCMGIHSCPGAREKLNWYQPLELCGFFDFEPVVCCEYVNQNVLQQLVTGQTTNIPTATTKKTPSAFFIGGLDALPLEFPHMAILGYGDSEQVQWRCGGSLISENFVLTAAHCIQAKEGEVKYVVLGAHQLSNANKNYLQAFTVKMIYRHPDYVTYTRYHDIALLELDRKANIRSGVKPARLHTSKDIPSKTLIATGWGATELYGENSDILQKGNLTYVPYEICERSYRTDRRLPRGLIDEWQLCADGGGKRRDTCQGDSGGPLQIRRPGDEMYTIIGITSLGISCATLPSVYTRVSYYVPWIESKIKRNK